MKKLFTNDKFFLLCVICAVAGQWCLIVQQLSSSELHLPTVLTLFVFAVCEIALYASFKAHEKNVMKGLMGALLMGHFVFAIFLLNSETPLETVFSAIHIVLLACLLVNHFVINAERSSMAKSVRANQVIAILCLVNILAWKICGCVTGVAEATVLSVIANAVGYFGVLAAIVCVESLLDSYRLNREAAGWTEEKGYPEGYVHEYEKKQEEK